MKSLTNPTDQQSLRERLARLQPDTAGRWGRMSAHQMVCHLADSFLAMMGEKSVSSATGPLQRTVVKWVALNSPFPWPKGVPTRPEMDQSIGGTRPSSYESDRELLLKVMARFSAANRDFAWSAHPIFGKLKDPEMLRWGYLHVDHHLRQFGL
jgi:hypothetical protein